MLLIDQILVSGIHESVDVFSAGIIPPNPVELLNGKLLVFALRYFCILYDCLIMKTLPVEFVADTLIIGKHVDMTIFVTRANYRLKSNIKLINIVIANKRLPKVNVVINGIELKKRRHAYHNDSYGHYGLYDNYGNNYDSCKYHVEKKYDT